MSVNLNFPNIVGTNTSDATATESDIAVGKTAYVNNVKVTGTKDWVDTSDATATASDIAVGKTAYVNNVKVTGTKEDVAQNVVWVDNVSGSLESVSDSSGHYPKLSVFIKEINIPNGITSIGNSAFLNCTSLESISIPDSVTSINSNTFQGCTNLANINISNGIKSIGYCAFYDCTSIESITLPNTLKSIGEYAFYNCKNLANIYYKGTGEQWNTITKGTNWNRLMGNSISGGTVIHYNS